MALNISLIILPNMHGYAFKPQAEAKEVNARQAALFASSTQLQALLPATMRTSQRDAPRRCEQKNQHVQYEQQGWQDASGSDKRFRSHCKQDAKDNTQLVDGDDTVFIRLVDYDLVDGQLAYAAGGAPSKPHEWMVSNPLSPNQSTVAAQAQNGFGRYGKLIVTGLINPEDYEVAEKKAEQLAPDSSPGLAHHPKMGAYSFTPLSVFEPPSDIKPGPEGDPTGPIAVNTRAVEPRGTSSKSTSDPCHGCTSPFVAGVAGKPRIQRPREFAVAATKDKAKDKEPRTAPLHLPVRQELPFDSDSEGASATIASVRKHPPPRTNYQPMIAHYRIDTRNGDWNIHQPANGDEARFAALAFRCLADDDLASSQLSPGTPASLPQDQVLINSLSPYPSFLALQAQYAASGYDTIIISGLRESQDDMPMEEVEDYVPSPPPTELAQPPEAGTDYEPASKTLPPPDEPDKELNDAQQSRVDNDPEQEPRPGSAVNVDYEPLLPEGQRSVITHVSMVPERKMRSNTRLASYVIPRVFEPPTDDDLGPEESLIGPIAAKARAASSLVKGPASKAPTKTADRRCGHTSMAVHGHMSVAAAGVAGNPIQWDVAEEELLPAVPRSTPKAVGTPNLRRGGVGSN